MFGFAPLLGSAAACCQQCHLVNPRTGLGVRRVGGVGRGELLEMVEDMSICCLERKKKEKKTQKTSCVSCPAAVLSLDSSTLKQENHPPSKVRRLLISSLKSIVCLIAYFTEKP